MNKKELAYLRQIADSFNSSCNLYAAYKDDYGDIPDNILNEKENKLLMKTDFSSSCKKIKKFINPQVATKLLDIGCFLNILLYDYAKWKSEYYGIDISENVIKECKKIVKKFKYSIGGVYLCPAHSIDFENNFFNYVTCINVFEYFSVPYAKQVLGEVHRVLKQNGKFAVDIPNPNHECFYIMKKVEKYFNRENRFLEGESKFEELIQNKFEIIDKDNADLMVKYFLIKKGL
jgi:ubiquinone/menaquinone biosynthesis C-methylase UbiE